MSSKPILGTGLIGAAEGAAAGGGGELSAAAMGKRELNGEKVAVAMGLGAAVGGTLGATFGAAGRGFEKLASRGRATSSQALAPAGEAKSITDLAKEVVEASDGYAPQVNESLLAKTLTKAQKASTGMDEGTRRLLSKAYERGPEGDLVRRDLIAPRGLQDEHANALIKELKD